MVKLFCSRALKSSLLLKYTSFSHYGAFQFPNTTLLFSNSPSGKYPTVLNRDHLKVEDTSLKHPEHEGFRSRKWGLRAFLTQTRSSVSLWCYMNLTHFITHTKQCHAVCGNARVESDRCGVRCGSWAYLSVRTCSVWFQLESRQRVSSWGHPVRERHRRMVMSVCLQILQDDNGVHAANFHSHFFQPGGNSKVGMLPGDLFPPIFKLRFKVSLLQKFKSKSQKSKLNIVLCKMLRISSEWFENLGHSPAQ